LGGNNVAVIGADVDDDARLIAETLAGNRAAFEQLVCKYQNRLFNTLWHLVDSREEAEDVAQEAFVQAFLKLDSFGGRSAFYTWLYRIAFNLAVSRRRRRRPEISVDSYAGGAGPEPHDRDTGPDEQLLRKERIHQVREAIQSLHEEHRAILVLREMDGCCYETIAEILDLPVGTVRSRLHRARLQLREQLKDLWKTHDSSIHPRPD
jgi:RNA polymerase sigma-70 factor, ECF subfamily